MAKAKPSNEPKNMERDSRGTKQRQATGKQKSQSQPSLQHIAETLAPTYKEAVNDNTRDKTVKHTEKRLEGGQSATKSILTSVQSYTKPNDDCYAKEFRDSSKRNSFLRNVYAMMTCQTMFVFEFLVFMNEVDATKFHNEVRIAVFITSAMLVMSYTALGFDKLKRRWPTQFIVLTIFSLSLAANLATISLCFQTKWIMVAFFLVAAVSLIMAFSAGECFTCIYLCITAVPLLSVWIWYVWFKRDPDQLISMCCGSVAAIFIVCFHMVAIQNVTLNKYERSNVLPSEHIYTVLNMYWVIVEMLIYLLKSVKEVILSCVSRGSYTIN